MKLINNLFFYRLGIGFGLSSLLLPVIINEYFFKQRSIALGMSYLGSPVGFFIFPPIFEALLNKYGLSGTFLIIAGINMHCLPLSMLLKPPNFKTERENSPLKYGEKHDSYSSTSPIITNLSDESKFENKKEPEINGKTDYFIRRHSIEFLWKQSGSKEQVADKKYVMSLSKRCCSCEEGDTKIQRSFRKSSKNNYENLDEKGNEKIQHALQCDAYKNDKTNSVATTIDKNNKNSNYFKTTGNTYYQNYEPYLKNIIAPTESHFGNEKLQLPHNFKKHKYEVVSTIYFGTEQSSYTLTDCKSHLEKKHLDEKNKYKRTENILSFPSHMKYDSVFDSAYSLKIPVLLKYEKADDFFRHANCDVYGKQTIAAPEPFTKNAAQSQNLLFSLYLNPVFILICIINAIVNLHFTSLITVIVDFSRDHNIDIEYEKYIMMGISFSGAFGMMGLGWVTDGGYMSKTHFGTLTQLISGICTIILPFTVGFESLMIALLVWCVCQSSFIPLIPAITADYFDEDIEAVAVSACNVLSGPLYLIIPPLIGKKFTFSTQNSV